MSKKEVNRVLNQFSKSGKDIFSDQSTIWLAKNLSKIQTQMRQEQYNRKRPSVSSPSSLEEGSMLFFGYDPKTKQKLQFWDTFPLVVLLHKQGNSFLGLNLHYLSPNLRANFLNSLLKYADNPEYANNLDAKMEVTYSLLIRLPKLKPFKAAIKRYYLSSIVTKVNTIPSNEWKYTTFMPLEKFQGATREEVWAWANKYIKS